MTNLSDSQEALSLPIESDRALTTPLKVSFYPNTDDLAHISEKINRAYKSGGISVYALQAFIVLNLTGIPAVLWFFDAFLLGFAAFVINAAYLLAVLPALRRQDYRTYFRTMFSSIENHLVEVELTDEGVCCRYDDDTSFHAWKSITLLEETKHGIYFFFEHNGLAVAKTGFAYDDEKDRFLAFAKSHVSKFEIN
jgi:hypothetical protein